MTQNKETEFKSSIDFNLLKGLSKFMLPYKKNFALLAVYLIVLAGVDAAFPLMTKYCIDSFISEKSLEKLPLFAAVYFVIIILQVVVVKLFIDYAGYINTNLVRDIRQAGFDKLQKLSFSYYDKTPVGWMMARMTSDSRKIADVMAWGLVDGVWGISLLIVISGAMLYMNWKLALISLVSVPFLFLVSIYFQKKMLKGHRSVRKINSQITASFNEGIMGAKTTKTLVREEKNFSEFKELTDEMYVSSVRTALFSALYLPSILFLTSVGTALAMYAGGKSVLMETISYGTLVAFISYTIQFFEPVFSLGRIMGEILNAQAAAERVFSMIETPEEIKDNSLAEEKYGSFDNPKKENWPEIKGEIEFRSVTFFYNKGENIIENFNLKVKAGQKIALVGETGAGKSTIVNLLCRFYEPSEGEILIDGTDYRERSLVWLQSSLGYVLQTPHLFSGTIMENIRYGRINATDDEVINSAKLVNAHEFIEKLERKYETEVGEGGSRLSTGEKQLLSFARALLANPRIFILDEATSSVDTETEMKIQDAIYKVLENRTSFIIAHRLSTIRSADRILVLKDGKIVEDGTHRELMKKKGYYYQMYTNQFLSEEEEKVLNEFHKQRAAELKI